ncbi:MAG: hypothetical protein WCK70_01990 [Chloroflexales bacterium]
MNRNSPCNGESSVAISKPMGADGTSVAHQVRWSISYRLSAIGYRMPDSPIFARCDELVIWVLRATVRYPRHFRAALGRFTQEAALLLQRDLVAAARRRDKRQALQAADEALSELRLLLRQGQALDLLTVGQYAHVVRLTDEVGRLLGGWRKSQARAASGGTASDE